MSKITDRIARKAGVPDLVDRLAGLGGSDLQSLLLEVAKRRAAARSPATLVSEYTRNRFTRPGRLDPRLQLELDRVAFSLLPPDFEPIALSPVVPLETCSAVATVDQNLALSTIRNTEVLSDSTNALALECAVRRRDRLARDPRSPERIKLAASHRLLRAQDYGEDTQRAAHFRLLGLVVAGRDEGSRCFEVETFPETIGYFVRLLIEGVEVPAERVRVAVTPLSGAFEDLAREHWLALLSERFPRLEVGLDPERTSGRGYYRDACFKVFARNAPGEEVELADGGFTDWTQQLLGNAKERLMIGGIGSEAVAALFGQSLDLKTPSERASSDVT